MSALRQFRRCERGNAFAFLAAMAAVAALLACAYVHISAPDIPAIVADVTPGPSVLIKGPDGMTEGIGISDKPAIVLLIGDEKP